MKLALRLTLGLAMAIIGATGRTTLATSYTNTIAQMSAYIINQMAVNNIPGLSIALVDDQTVVWAAGFGSADREGGVAADTDTVYHIGSCSKAFLGTAYMQLRDQGRVDIETNLTHYMPEFSMLSRFTNSEPVTIRSLLNHHSGLPGDLFNGLVTTRTLDDFPGWLINYLQNDYPFAPPNERSSYCNSGFVLLSDVVRRITGTNFAAATDAMILTPLGMDASSFLPDKAAISNRLAAAYNTEGERQPAEIVNALGSGSMYSSANDLTKYIQMILANGQYNGQPIVSSNGIDTMTEPQGTNLPLNVSDSFTGLGWDEVNDDNLRYAGKFFWKDGATYMHSAFLAISRDLKLGVAVIQNTTGSQCDTIGTEALRWAILDKTITNHWPTNTFVPTNSPVTNWPQTNLNALAGLYVGDSGYYKVAAETGTITIIKDAYTPTPTSYSNLTPRANGWLSLTNSQDVQFAFTNLSGHDMLVVHQVNGAFEAVALLGEHYIPGTLLDTWSIRTNRVYRIVDLCPTDYFWEPGMSLIKTLRFQTKDGALLIHWMFGDFVEDPQNDNLAFQRGVQYRKGGAVQVTTTNLPGRLVRHSLGDGGSASPFARPLRRDTSAELGGFEMIQYSSFRFLDEAAIPTLPVPAITNGAIPFANGTQWYWFTGQAGKTYRARLTAPNQNYFVRITDREGITGSSGTNGPATWTCASNGTYAIAVSATNAFAFTASLTVVGLRPTQNDFDGDGAADPAVYQAGQLYVALSAAGYSVQTIAMNGSGGIECSADYDGDGMADPAVYEPAAGRLLLRLSSQSYTLVTTPMGGAGCLPVIGDFDGDRQADPAVYSATAGLLNTWLSGSGYSAASVPLGGTDWINACEDYDGDGLTDPAVYQCGDPSTGSTSSPQADSKSSPQAGSGQGGTWQVLLSENGYALSSLVTAGGVGVVPVPGDYDGDGKADLATFQPATGLWLLALSSQGYAQTLNNGLASLTMLPRPGDYDNDGQTDLALFDPMVNAFYVWLSGSDYRLAILAW